MSVKVLLVEDEKSIADGIIYNLKNEGLKVTHVDDGKIALDIFDEEHFDLIILDIMLPEVSGLEICKTIRKSSNVPIIMLTAKDDENDKIEVQEGESLEDIKAKLKPKKAAISAEMLDTANTYDDKVAVIRMIVGDEAGRVSSVFKNMMEKE